MTKRGVIRCLLSVLLLAYLAVALAYAHSASSADNYKSLNINIAQTQSSGFVTSEDIDFELGALSKKISKLHRDSVNTLAIERAILGMDNIENANCVVLSNGEVSLDIVPLVPLARVFDLGTGTNYYINKDGKRMKANAQYRLDVPVVTGRFEKVSPATVLPVLRHISTDPRLAPLASSLKVERNGDIYLIPRLKGHVVNIGDTLDLADKTSRLMAFYHKVLPVKGWEYYDTISVKWRGQVVAKRHNRRANENLVPDFDEDYIDDPSTMMTDDQESNNP